MQLEMVLPWQAWYIVDRKSRFKDPREEHCLCINGKPGILLAAVWANSLENQSQRSRTIVPTPPLRELDRNSL
jgi:hypothetical protein